LLSLYSQIRSAVQKNRLTTKPNENQLADTP
jgi:hypothetical protein